MLEITLDGEELPLDPAERVWLGKYELLHRLGAGGMAELFLARTIAIHGFEKLVALKRVLAEHADNQRLIEMLLGEARLAATLHHPNIVQVYDVGEDDGTFFFTMEYIQGKDLRRLIRAAHRKGTWLPLEHLINIMIHAAAGLHYAHEQKTPDGTVLGIVHRDISPSNIIVSYDGAVKIVDFGIAKATTDPENAAAGALKGKVPYMSPEQCRGEDIDRRSDVFSLGIILWELSLGKRLFTNLKGRDLVEHIARNPAPPPSQFKPDYPKDLEQIVMRALALDPAKRYATARELEMDLEEFARQRRLSISQARLAEFMRDLFAEEIKEEEAAVKDYLTLNLPTPPPAAKAQPSLPPQPSVQYTQALQALNQSEALQAILAPLAEPVPEPPAWRRYLPVVVVAAAALLIISAIFAGGGTETTAPAHRPSSGDEAAWDADLLENKPTSVPEPRRIVVSGSEPAAKPPREPSASEGSTKPTPTKKTTTTKKTKKKVKLPDNWDPNSPLPPPK
ncbi:MAG: serine/threonine protein kinase [Myxococcales bacterium]|nr:serine/threonine protein kinase [Myxococcales bacterium]MCB9702444.1 serine/threonine protein kinase [Myxococcales bacterium]